MNEFRPDFTAMARGLRGQEAVEGVREIANLWDISIQKLILNFDVDYLSELAKNLHVDRASLEIAFLDYSMQRRLHDDTSRFGMRYADRVLLAEDLHLFKLLRVSENNQRVYLKHAIAETVEQIWNAELTADSITELRDLEFSFFELFQKTKIVEIRDLEAAFRQKKSVLHARENVARIEQMLPEFEVIDKQQLRDRTSNLNVALEMQFDFLKSNIVFLEANRYEEENELAVDQRIFVPKDSPNHSSAFIALFREYFVRFMIARTKHGYHTYGN